MRKNWLIACLTVAISITLFSSIGAKESVKLAESDKYKVIRVDGKIIFQRTKEDMKKGDIFLSGTPLMFKTPQARAAIISSLKGRFVLSASQKGQTKMLPAANNISSRSGALINFLDLQNHFEGRYLVLDKMALEIGSENFPMSKNQFFYVSYAHNGEKIRKKLAFEEGNKLVLDKDEIFKIDGEPIPVKPTEMVIYYRDGDNSTKISTFVPIFPDLDELKDEVEIIQEEFTTKSDTDKVEEITAYLTEFYGKPQKDNLLKWLKKEFDLNGE